VDETVDKRIRKELRKAKKKGKLGVVARVTKIDGGEATLKGIINSREPLSDEDRNTLEPFM